MSREATERRAKIVALCKEVKVPVTISWLAHKLAMRGDTGSIRNDVKALVAEGRLSTEVILTAMIDPVGGMPRSREQKLLITWAVEKE